MANATFYAERHIYEHEGVVVPSVTQVLALAGIDDVSGIPLHYSNVQLESEQQFIRPASSSTRKISSWNRLLVHRWLRSWLSAVQTGTRFFPLTIEQKVSDSRTDHISVSPRSCRVIDGKPVLLDIRLLQRGSEVGYSNGRLRGSDQPRWTPTCGSRDERWQLQTDRAR